MGPCRRASTSRRLPGLFFWSNHFFASEYATSTKSYAVLRRSSPACFANLALLPGCKIRSKARFLRSISLSLKPDSRPRIGIQSNLCFLSLMAKIPSTSFTRNFLPLMLISSSVSAWSAALVSVLESCEEAVLAPWTPFGCPGLRDCWSCESAVGSGDLKSDGLEMFGGWSRIWCLSFLRLFFAFLLFRERPFRSRWYIVAPRRRWTEAIRRRWGPCWLISTQHDRGTLEPWKHRGFGSHHLRDA